MPDLRPEDFDEHCQWTGTCETCGTDHGGMAPGTLGGETACIRAQAEALGAAGILDQLDGFEASVAARREAAIAAYFSEGEG